MAVARFRKIHTQVDYKSCGKEKKRKNHPTVNVDASEVSQMERNHFAACNDKNISQGED